MKEDNYITFPQICSNYCNFIDSCGALLYFTSSKRRQENKVKEIDAEISKIKQYKGYAISQKAEEEANQFFHMQCMLNAIKSILSLWIEVKDSNYRKAWDVLIDGQEYIKVALKINDYEGVRFIEELLINIEKSIFPRTPLYLSSGHIETIGKCSICKNNFNLCDHIENKIYMGQLCQRIEKKIIKCDHVALVKNPKDRKCIITERSDEDGNMIDNFTGEICGKRQNDNLEGMQIEGSCLTLSSLDFS